MNEIKNVEFVVRNKLCISCGICKLVCPLKAIKMRYNEDYGMIFPIIDEKVCNECKLCLTICYGFKVDNQLNLEIFHKLPTSIIGNYIDSYIGFSTNKMLRFNSTSGGIVTALLIYALEEKLIDGAIVTRMEAGNPPRAKAFIATTTEHILSSIGSKYCPVSLAECLEATENDKKYAVVGLPCHIYGIRKLVEFSPKIRKSIILYIGILCGGMPSYLGLQYLLRVHNLEKQHITKFEYRGGGWPGRLLIQNESFNHRKEISIPYPEYWQGTFAYFSSYRCTLCHNGFNEFSDISCGDAWLPHLIKKDNKGTSLIIARTKKGERLVKNAFQKGFIQTTPINSQDILRSQKGLVRYKNFTLKARINVSKLIGRKIPIFDLSRINSSNLIGYLLTIELYIINAIATRKNLFWLFNIYIQLRKKIIKFTSIFMKI